MGRVLTNATTLQVSEEATPGVLAGTPIWFELEPNDQEQLGAEITKTSRSPISKSRQRKPGTTTDLDSSVQYQEDVTLEQFQLFAPGFVFADYVGPIGGYQASGTARNTLAANNSSAGYTHAALSAAIPAGRLVFARGFTVAANNGLKIVDSGGSTTLTPVTTTVTDETPSLAANATLEVCGVRGAAGDLEINASGNLISSTLDFDTLGLTPGQFIHVGGLLAANQFFNAENYGLARVVSIDTNVIVLDKKDQTYVTDDGTDTGSGGTNKSIDILFGRFLRNVDVDDSDFVEKTYQFEAGYPNLFAGPLTGYEYAIGNYANEMAINGPLTDKIGVTMGFVGLDTEVPTSTRKTGGATPVRVVRDQAFNTTNDELRLRITQLDETGITTCFTDWTLTLRNNVAPQKCQGTLGAVYMNYGNFEVDLEADVLFTDPAVVTAIRTNEVVTMEAAVRNGDGGFVVDIPAMTLGDGSKDFPVNEAVHINVTAEAHEDTTLGTSIGISLFPVLPAAA